MLVVVVTKLNRLTKDSSASTNTVSYDLWNIFACQRLVYTRQVTEYAPANFKNRAFCEKYYQFSPFGAKIWSDNCPRTLSVPQSSVFLKLHYRKTVRFSEQIMSTDKYPSIFSRQMTAIFYIFSLSRPISVKGGNRYESVTLHPSKWAGLQSLTQLLHPFNLRFRKLFTKLGQKP